MFLIIALLVLAGVDSRPRDSAISAFIHCAFRQASEIDDGRTPAGDVADASINACSRSEGMAWKEIFDFNSANHLTAPDQRTKKTISRIKSDLRPDLILMILRQRAQPSGSKPRA